MTKIGKKTSQQNFKFPTGGPLKCLFILKKNPTGGPLQCLTEFYKVITEMPYRTYTKEEENKAKWMMWGRIR